jgi:hypothetical protein
MTKEFCNVILEVSKISAETEVILKELHKMQVEEICATTIQELKLLGNTADESECTLPSNYKLILHRATKKLKQVEKESFTYFHDQSQHVHGQLSKISTNKALTQARSKADTAWDFASIDALLHKIQKQLFEIEGILRNNEASIHAAQACLKQAYLHTAMLSLKQEFKSLDNLLARASKLATKIQWTLNQDGRRREEHAPELLSMQQHIQGLLDISLATDAHQATASLPLALVSDEEADEKHNGGPRMSV